jgi:hypothetical protein
MRDQLLCAVYLAEMESREESESSDLKGIAFCFLFQHLAVWCLPLCLLSACLELGPSNQ